MASLVETFDPAYYPWWTLNYFLIIWLLSKLVEFGLSHSHEESIKSKFCELSTEKKTKNVITYIVEIVVTTFAFVAQILGGTETLLRGDALATSDQDLVLLSLQAVSILYIWELVYRERFGWPLLIHHLITILFVQLVTVSFATEHHVAYLRFAIALGFYATTEQASFFALYCYRLEIYSSRIQGYLLWLASGMAFLTKSAVTIGCAVYYVLIMAEDSDSNAVRGSNWGVFWRYCFLPLLAGLFCSQLYACKILFDLGNARIQRGLLESESTNGLTTKQDNKVKEDPEIGSGAAEPHDDDDHNDHHDGETHSTETTVVLSVGRDIFPLDEGGDDDDDAEDDIQRKHPDCSNTPLDV